MRTALQRNDTVWSPRSILMLLAATIFLVCPVIQSSAWTAAPAPDLWPYWKHHDPENTVAVDHKLWANFLSAYLVTDHSSGVNRVRYGSVTAQDKKNLGRYIDELQSVPVTGLNQAEQRAFWINAYNALVAKLVLDNYPIGSIRDIDISGWFAKGPWKAKLLTVEGKDLSLNDIEHRILRPVWRDNRIHYALNCASIGCPNLQPAPFTADNTEELLKKAAHEFINHPRAVRFTDEDVLVASSIYKWYEEDFGDSPDGVLQHLLLYAQQPLAEKINNFQGKITFAYDWRLNEP